MKVGEIKIEPLSNQNDFTIQSSPVESSNDLGRTLTPTLPEVKEEISSHQQMSDEDLITYLTKYRLQTAVLWAGHC